MDIIYFTSAASSARRRHVSRSCSRVDLEILSLGDGRGSISSDRDDRTAKDVPEIGQAGAPSRFTVRTMIEATRKEWGTDRKEGRSRNEAAAFNELGATADLLNKSASPEINYEPP